DKHVGEGQRLSLLGNPFGTYERNDSDLRRIARPWPLILRRLSLRRNVVTRIQPSRSSLSVNRIRSGNPNNFFRVDTVGIQPTIREESHGQQRSTRAGNSAKKPVPHRRSEPADRDQDVRPAILGE